MSNVIETNGLGVRFSGARLLELELKYAVHQNDHDRANLALRSLKNLPKHFDWSLALIGELVHAALVNRQYLSIQQTLAFEFWTETEVEELIQQIRSPTELSKRWRAASAAERAYAIVSFDSGHSPFEFGLPGAMLPISPYRYLRMAKEWESIADDGPQELLRRASPRPNEQSSGNGIAFHLVAQPFAKMYERTETLRRLTVTALGLKRFQFRNDQWPGSLSDLDSIGLAASDYSTVQRVPFHYELTENGCQVSTTKRPTDEFAAQAKLGAWTAVSVGNLTVVD